MAISPLPSLCCISEPVSLNVFIYLFNFLFQVIPSHLPLEAEIRENCCVLTPGYHYVAGRVHEIKGNKYRVEKLIDANRDYKGQTIRLHSFEREKLRVIFSAWCGKHCMNIVPFMNYLREISQFVFFNNSILNSFSCSSINYIILIHEKFLQFDWLRAWVFQLNLKYLHVKITNLLQVVV